MKRATKYIKKINQRLAISIHALVKRATNRCKWQLPESSNFNPRPREEGDKKLVGDLDYKIISIHALVKRATEDAYLAREYGIISIHALVKRAT